MKKIITLALVCMISTWSQSAIAQSQYDDAKRRAIERSEAARRERENARMRQQRADQLAEARTSQYIDRTYGEFINRGMLLSKSFVGICNDSILMAAVQNDGLVHEFKTINGAPVNRASVRFKANSGVIKNSAAGLLNTGIIEVLNVHYYVYIDSFVKPRFVENYVHRSYGNSGPSIWKEGTKSAVGHVYTPETALTVYQFRIKFLKYQTGEIDIHPDDIEISLLNRMENREYIKGLVFLYLRGDIPLDMKQLACPDQVSDKTRYLSYLSWIN